ncbi:CAP domain-containing protein [Nocardioides sediminis]|uniref:CAP domain-containing protein n=1 Tax=Nocardioides sediminis TaxID=433648 RepID=UPI002277F89C|nr:CAP domain-containing protein [Nocardioides sediminis]
METDAPTAKHRVHGPVTPRATAAIDTTSQSAVRRAYRRFWLRGEEVRPRWIGGDTDRCRPGRLADTSTRRQLQAINFARRMTGLQKVVLDKGTVRHAQAAALIMTAEHAVSHYPPRDWPCWTRRGYEAAAQSNLYEGTSRQSNSDKIEAYLDDWGGNNHRVGHRRWLLYPYLAAVGIGGTNRANVTHLFGTPFDKLAPNPQWVPWPSAGWFPNNLDPRGRWSLGSGEDGTDFSRATVAVSFNDKPVKGIKLRTPDNGVGKPTLVWEMPNRTWPKDPVGKAEVTVEGIVIDGLPQPTAAYAIRFFRTAG